MNRFKIKYWLLEEKDPHWYTGSAYGPSRDPRHAADVWWYNVTPLVDKLMNQYHPVKIHIEATKEKEKTDE